MLDERKYRYHKAISDLSGFDIKSHAEKKEEIIRQIRNWIRVTIGKVVESGTEIFLKYLKFDAAFQTSMELANFKKKDIDGMNPKEYIDFVKNWVE